MKHEDEMTPGEYRRFKADFRNNEHGHTHLCNFCEQPWECPQLWHCRRPRMSICPDCYIKNQEEKAKV